MTERTLGAEAPGLHEVEAAQHQIGDDAGHHCEELVRRLEFHLPDQRRDIQQQHRRRGIDAAVQRRSETVTAGHERTPEMR